MICNKCGYDDRGTGDAHYCSQSKAETKEQFLRRIEALEKTVASILLRLKNGDKND